MKKELCSLFALISMVLAACSMPAKPDQSIQAATPITPLETPTIATIAQADPSPTHALPAVVPSPTPLKRITSNPTPTAAITIAPAITYLYELQAGTPVQTANFVDVGAGCNWMGVGGQVFNKSEQPVKGLIAEVGGNLGESSILSLALTGGSTILGPGGFVIKLADQPVESNNTLWIQLFDLAGSPQSEKVYFSTFAGNEGCEKNLVIINFRELGTLGLEYYFPSIYKNGR